MPTYEKYIPEDTPLETMVIIITAKDPDDGPNGVVRYSLTSGATDKFSIDESMGIVTTTATFDYETGQRQFTVMVH